MSNRMKRSLLVFYGASGAALEEKLCNAVLHADIDVDNITYTGVWKGMSGYRIEFSFAMDNGESTEDRISNDMDSVIAALSDAFPDSAISKYEGDDGRIVIDLRETKKGGE